MSNKIMGLIELAMQVKGERCASIDFNGFTQGVTLFISDSGTHKVIKRIVCYLDSENAEQILDAMKDELEKMLKSKAA